jgi:hypothetical protein
MQNAARPQSMCNLRAPALPPCPSALRQKQNTLLFFKSSFLGIKTLPPCPGQPLRKPEHSPGRALGRPIGLNRHIALQVLDRHIWQRATRQGLGTAYRASAAGARQTHLAACNKARRGLWPSPNVSICCCRKRWYPSCMPVQALRTPVQRASRVTSTTCPQPHRHRRQSGHLDETPTWNATAVPQHGEQPAPLQGGSTNAPGSQTDRQHKCASKASHSPVDQFAPAKSGKTPAPRFRHRIRQQAHRTAPSHHLLRLPVLTPATMPSPASCASQHPPSAAWRPAWPGAGGRADAAGRSRACTPAMRSPPRAAPPPPRPPPARLPTTHGVGDRSAAVPTDVVG